MKVPRHLCGVRVWNRIATNSLIKNQYTYIYRGKEGVKGKSDKDSLSVLSTLLKRIRKIINTKRGLWPTEISFQ